MKKSLLMLCCGLLSLGCNSNGTGTKGHGYEKRTLAVKETFQGTHPIRVVCTTGMVADLVRSVGGPAVKIQLLMQEGVDPHLYQPSTGDVAKLQEADLIFYNGLHLEGKMGQVLDSFGRKKPTFPVCEYLEKEDVLHGPESLDPHVWFNVELWRQGAGVVRDVLAAYDPAHAADYRSRAATYQAELAKLHGWVKEQIATIPTEQRALITSHDAFHYFGKAYGIEVKAIQGISTESEASLRDINLLVEFIAQRKIKAVFVETSVNPRNMQALREGCQARGHQVALGGELFSDAMGADGTPEGTYVGMIQHNVETIVKALR